MAHTPLLFDSDRANNGIKDRTFAVADTNVARIRAAGLAAGEEVPIYVRVGSSSKTRATGNTPANNQAELDYVWTPLSRCGAPVVLTPESNEHIESIPGVYMVGPPAGLTFAGDVNIDHDKLGEEYLNLPGKCDESPLPVTLVPDPAAPPQPVKVDSSCAEPVFVELCEAPTFMVETALAELGCVTDANGVITGKVMVLRLEDEETGVVTTSRVLYNVDGTQVDNYTGPFGSCPAADDDLEALPVCYTDGVTGASRQALHIISRSVSGVLSTSFAEPDGTAIITNPADTFSYGECPDNLNTGHTEAGCAGGVPWTRRTTVVRSPSGAISATFVSYVNSAGVEQPVPPAGFKLGACPVVPEQIKIITHGQNFASAPLQGDYDPNGNGPVWAQPPGALLQSFTVVVRKADLLPGGANRVLVAGLPDGKYFLSEGDIRTWSVAQDATRNEHVAEMPIEVIAEGDSAFDVTWTTET